MDTALNPLIENRDLYLSRSICTANENTIYDFAIALPVGHDNSHTFSKAAQAILASIAVGMGEENIAVFYSSCRQKSFVLIRATVDKLKNFADLHNYPLLLDSEKLKERAMIGWPDNVPKVDPIKMDENRPEITSYSPYEYIYGRYEIEEQFQELYGLNPFPDHVRLDLIRRILTEPTEMGGLEIKFRYPISLHLSDSFLIVYDIAM